MLEKFLHDELERLSTTGLARKMRLVESAQGPVVRMGSREVLQFCSNDYLGLADHPLVKEAAISAIEKWGFGAGASRLVTGNMEAHESLESAIKVFKGTEAALVFNSGYHANLGCITALAGRDAEVFSDKLNHASIVDACLLSNAKLGRYANNDISSLEKLLKRSTARQKLIVTDGVFSMDGTIAKIPEIIPLLEKYGACLYVDDAHATGVLGKNGKGTLEYFNISHPDVIQMGTLGKALGSFGAFIAGSKPLIDFLISKSRPFVYTTALPPAVCAAAQKAIELASSTALRKKLWENVSYLKSGLVSSGHDTMGSQTQIIPVFIGDAQNTMKMSQRLLEKGIFIQGIRPPTVPQNTSRLRITVTASHTKAQIDELLSALKECL